MSAFTTQKDHLINAAKTFQDDCETLIPELFHGPTQVKHHALKNLIDAHHQIQILIQLISNEKIDDASIATVYGSIFEDVFFETNQDVKTAIFPKYRLLEDSFRKYRFLRQQELDAKDPAVAALAIHDLTVFPPLPTRATAPSRG